MLLGVAFALAIVAGQGYVQIGFVLLLPLLAILIVGGPAPAAVVVRRLLVAAVLGLLLAAPLVVPVLHFLPELAKGIDGQFTTAQPLKFTLLNLLVDDAAFYRTEILGKMPFPAIYAHFIGWIPLVLAIWGLGSRRVTGSARHGLFLGATALGALWLATASPFAWLARTFSSLALQNFIMGVRFTPLFIGLAVPPILALAGIGVARLLLLSWPRFSLGVSGMQDKPASFLELNTQVLLVIPLVLALAETYSFGRAYIYSAPVIHGVGEALDALKTPDLQWVDTPYGEQFWMEAAAARDLKVSTGTQGWSWANREPPLPVRTLSRGNPPPGMTAAGVAGGLNVYASGPGREYAVVSGADGRRFACQAHGGGGDITVSCEAAAAGMLTVAENVWPGWQARVDGQAVPLYGQPFIALPLRPGAHTVSLKYRPYDVLAGGLLFLVGIVWAAYLWSVKDTGPRQVKDSTRSDEPPAVDGAG